MRRVRHWNERSQWVDGPIDFNGLRLIGGHGGLAEIGFDLADGGEVAVVLGAVLLLERNLGAALLHVELGRLRDAV